MTFRTSARRRIFVDTSAYAALVLPRDENFGRATAIVQALAAERALLYTTNFVAAETHAFVLARAGRLAARRMLTRIDEGANLVVRVDPDDERQARTILDRFQDKDFSLVDAMSFVVMERLRISVAFTFDRHFQQFGFVVAAPR